MPAWKKNYYLYQSANFISLLGDFLGSMALHWWVLKHSEGMDDLSSIFFVGTMVRLISLPLFGPIGDRFCRKSILNIADLSSCILCFVLAAFIYFDEPNLPALCTLTGLLSLSSSLFRAGSIGMIPELVPTEKIPWAIAQNQTLLTVSFILGGAVGSLFISSTGVFWTIILNALAIAVAIVLIRCINLKHSVIKRAQGSITLMQWGQDFVQALQFIKKEKLILSSLVIIVLINALLTPFDLILPYYVQKVRLGSVWQLGLIESSIGIGSIIGSLVFGFKFLRADTLKTVLSALVIIAMSLFLFGLAKSIGALIILGGLFGLGEVLFFVPIRTKLVLSMPHHFRSRVGVILAFGQQLGKPLVVAMTAFALKSFIPLTILATTALLILLIIPIILLIPLYAKFLSDSEPFIFGQKSKGEGNLNSALLVKEG